MLLQIIKMLNQKMKNGLKIRIIDMNAVKILIVLIISSIALPLNAQTTPKIVDQDEFSVTVKFKGEYKTMTKFDIIDAMTYGEMAKLPLPYSVETKKLWVQYDEDLKIQISKIKANPIGELALQSVKESFMQVFSEPDAMKHFIDKAVLGNGMKSNKSNN